MLLPTDARPGCMLTRFKCSRLRWAMASRDSFPTLASVEAEDIERLEHIVPDFEDLCDRHGLFIMPDDTPDTRRERVAERFFVNRFYPWTSNGLERL